MDQPYGPMLLVNPKVNAACQGVILFKRHDSRAASGEEEKVLEVFVSGDSALCVHNQLQGAPTSRPMALDLMWQVLQRGREVSKREWTLLRAAIVDIRDQVYIGRLFFGDPATQKVLWDCDCRPSDATFLSLQAKSPFYVHRKVWEHHAQQVRDTDVYKAVQHTKRAIEAEAAKQAAAAVAGGSGALDANDPTQLETIKLLTRELEVAVHEEDYAEAARLRDHPYMRMAADIEMYTKIGYSEKARELFGSLKAQIEAHESLDQEDYETRVLRRLSSRRGGSAGSQRGAPAPGDAETVKKESGQE